MNYFFCVLTTKGHLTLFIQTHFKSVVNEDDIPAYFHTLKACLEKAIEQTQLTGSSLIDAQERLEAYHNLVTLSQMADQIFVSDDVQICKTDSLVFSTPDHLMDGLNRMKPHVPLGLVTKMSKWIGWARFHSWLTQGFQDAEQIQTIITDQQTGKEGEAIEGEVSKLGENLLKKTELKIRVKKDGSHE